MHTHPFCFVLDINVNIKWTLFLCSTVVPKTWHIITFWILVFLANTAGQFHVPCLVTYQGLQSQSELIGAHRVKTIAPLNVQVCILVLIVELTAPKPGSYPHHKTFYNRPRVPWGHLVHGFHAYRVQDPLNIQCGDLESLISHNHALEGDTGHPVCCYL